MRYDTIDPSVLSPIPAGHALAGAKCILELTKHNLWPSIHSRYLRDTYSNVAFYKHSLAQEGGPGEQTMHVLSRMCADAFLCGADDWARTERVQLVSEDRGQEPFNEWFLQYEGMICDMFSYVGALTVCLDSDVTQIGYAMTALLVSGHIAAAKAPLFHGRPRLVDRIAEHYPELSPLQADAQTERYAMVVRWLSVMGGQIVTSLIDAMVNAPISDRQKLARFYLRSIFLSAATMVMASTKEDAVAAAVAFQEAGEILVRENVNYLDQASRALSESAVSATDIAHWTFIKGLQAWGRHG